MSSTIASAPGEPSKNALLLLLIGCGGAANERPAVTATHIIPVVCAGERRVSCEKRESNDHKSRAHTGKQEQRIRQESKENIQPDKKKHTEIKSAKRNKTGKKRKGEKEKRETKASDNRKGKKVKQLEKKRKRERQERPNHWLTE